MTDSPTDSFVEAMRELYAGRVHKDCDPAECPHRHSTEEPIRQAVEAFADEQCHNRLAVAIADGDKDDIETEERHNHAKCRIALLKRVMGEST